MVSVGDRVVVRSGYTFDGEIGIVTAVEKHGLCVRVDVPSYNGRKPEDAWWCDNWEPTGVWAEKLEAEKDLETVLLSM